MLPPTHDSVKSDEDTHTPPFNDSFLPNTDKLHHLLKIRNIVVTQHEAQLRTRVTEILAKIASLTPGGETNQIVKLLKGLGEAIDELTGGVLVVNEVMPVLFVAVVEAYLKDVLIFAAGIDVSLMERTDQTMSYKKRHSMQGL